jgi:hypothetical protein
VKPPDVAGEQLLGLDGPAVAVTGTVFADWRWVVRDQVATLVVREEREVLTNATRQIDLDALLLSREQGELDVERTGSGRRSLAREFEPTHDGQRLAGGVGYRKVLPGLAAAQADPGHDDPDANRDRPPCLMKDASHLFTTGLPVLVGVRG